MKPNFFKAVFIFYIVFTICGCRTVNTVAPREKVADRRMIEDERIITDPILGVRAQVVGVNEALTPGGFYQVQVEVKNTTNHLKHFEYKFEWFDQNGNLIPSAVDSYKVRESMAKDSIYLNSIAPTQDARDFKLKLIRSSR